MKDREKKLSADVCEPTRSCHDYYQALEITACLTLPACSGNSKRIVPDSRWGHRVRCRSRVGPPYETERWKPPKQWDLGHLWDVVRLGVVGFRDRGIAEAPSAPRTARGGPGWAWKRKTLGARCAGGRERDPCYDLGPSSATSYDGAPHGPSTDQNLPCHGESHVNIRSAPVPGSRSGGAVENVFLSNLERCIATPMHQGQKLLF